MGKWQESRVAKGLFISSLGDRFLKRSPELPQTIKLYQALHSMHSPEI